MHDINIQRATRQSYSPSFVLLRKWANTTLSYMSAPPCELTLRIVSSKEMTELNGTYRDKHKATNVLSFPSSLPDEIDLPKKYLGDIALCAEVINQEAASQNKTTESHWAHMIVHGLLHLLGYDHEEEGPAEIMEQFEIKILASMGYAHPYQ